MSLLDADLGEGRGWAKVGDGYAVTKKPRSLDRTKFPEIPFAAMEAIPQGGAYLPDFLMKPGDAIGSGTYFERGDVLVGKITPSFENGKQALIQDLPAPFGYATTEVIPLHPISDRHDPRFLFFYLLHPDVRHYVAERMEGSTGRQRVSDYVLLDLPIPELEPDEQKVVADAVETLHQAISAEAACEETARDLKRAAMRTLFTRGLRGEAQKETEIGLIPDSWELKPLGFFGRLGNGSTPKKSIDGYWEGGNFPWLTSAKVYHRDIVSADQFVTQEALEKCHLPIVEPGAILVAITGQGKTLGNCAVLRMRATINQHLAYVATDLLLADPSYLRGYLETQYEYFRQVGGGGGSTKGALTCAFLRGVAIPCPPTLDEQREIVAILDAIDRKIELHRRKRAVLDELFKALLHKLMTGEIRVSDLDLSALSSNSAATAKQTPEVAA